MWSEIYRDPADKERGEVEAFSPAEFTDGSTRRRDAVERWGFAAFDADNDEADRYLSFDEACDLLAELNFALYSTTKSRPEHNRYRVVLPISRPVEAAEFEAFWSAANELMGGVFDHRTRDPSRIFFVPAAWDGADNRFACRTDGATLDVDALMSIYPPPVAEPSPVPSQITTRLASTLVDPAALVTPEMVEDYLIAPPGSGRFFRFMCRVAARAASLGCSISAPELEALALDMDRSTSHPKHRPGSLREAEQALRFVESRPLHAPQAQTYQLDRIRRLQARAGR